MDVSVRIEGADRLERQLKRLPGNIAGRVLRAAVRKGAIFLKRKMQDVMKAWGYSRKTRQAVKVQNQRNPTPTSVEVHLGNDRSAPYLRLIEEGTAPHYIETTGQVLGFKAKSGDWVTFGRYYTHPGITPKSWMRATFDANIEQAERIIAEQLDILIERQLERL